MSVGYLHKPQVADPSDVRTQPCTVRGCRSRVESVPKPGAVDRAFERFQSHGLSLNPPVADRYLRHVPR